MAEETESTTIEAQDEAATLPRRQRGRKNVTKKRSASLTTASRTATTGTSRRKPLRSLATLAMVGGLVATVALPAYAATVNVPVAEAAQTLQQASSEDAQSLVVASNATGTELTRDSYSATTEGEIEKKKAEEAAAAAAAERARSAQLAAKSQSTSTGGATPLAPVDLSMVNAGSGEVRWPMAGGTFNLGDGYGAGRNHQGIDMLAAGGTPMYAAASGVVRVSQDGFGAYGNAITIDHVINGQRVSTLYAHIMYGGRQVVAGQTVEVGQLIALVGSTGRSTANHLHFEVFMGGTQHVDPLAWLQANAG